MAQDSLSSRASNSNASTLSAAFILLPDFTMLAFAGFIDTLRLAADENDGSRQIRCRWTILGHDLSPVRASCGASVTPWEIFRAIPEYDYVIVVGGLTSSHRKIPQRTIDYIRNCGQQSHTMVGLCTGSFVLARAGLLDSSRCCVHHYHAPEFRQLFPHVQIEPDTLYLVDRRIVTCVGGTSVIDLAINLVERELGVAKAAQIPGATQHSKPRPHNFPQVPFHSECPDDLDDPLVRRAALLARQYVDGPLSVHEVAKRLCVSPRNLSRRFTAQLRISPAKFFRQVRLEIADSMLRDTDKPIGSIARECGFVDVSHFTRSYRAYCGKSPSQRRIERSHTRS